MKRHRDTHRRLLRIAVDTGGTFTDCVWVENGQLKIAKVFSTPDDPSRAILEALRRTGLRDCDLVLLHGTTVGTNTLLERKGAKVAFITTAGFEDALEIGRQARGSLYDLSFERTMPLASAQMRFGIEERTNRDGSVMLKPLAEGLRALASEVAKSKPQAVAVSLLFSYANSGNELAVSEALREARLEVPQSLSHQILPEFREYERASTVVINAYLQPVMGTYLDRLKASVQEWHESPEVIGADRAAASQLGNVFVMQSSGGITSLDSASREPVRTVLSGPAGGVMGAAAMGRRSGFDKVIGFDMGGTSTDVALVDGVPRASGEGELAGLPVRVPMLEIHTVGAGGGSLARFDAAGALRVGPESAGADPGPICYGRGEQPTVTDANLLLGRLRPDQFLGGDFTLDIERTRRIAQTWLQNHGSSLSVEDFAAGVVRVVNATMEKAVRVVSVERGYDPREFALVAFGGAGALHAAELAVGLGVPRVIVPLIPGALSAFGILVSDVVKDYSRSVLLQMSADGKLPSRSLEQSVQELNRAADQDFRSEGWTGKIAKTASADVRYQGQGYELNVPFGPDLVARFRTEHHRRYGYSYESRAIEIVTLRLRASLRSPQHNIMSRARPVSPRGIEAAAMHVAVRFGSTELDSTVHTRSSLHPGRRYRGPAVITEYSATAVVPPSMNFYVDDFGAIIIET